MDKLFQKLTQPSLKDMCVQALLEKILSGGTEKSSASLPVRRHYGRGGLWRVPGTDRPWPDQPPDAVRSARMSRRVRIRLRRREAAGHHQSRLSASAQGRQNREASEIVRFSAKIACNFQEVMVN